MDKGVVLIVNAWLQTALNGLSSGLEIAALAVAFATVYRPTGVLFFALGGIYVVTPYLVVALRSVQYPWIVAIPVAVLSGAAISLACEVFNHAFLDRRNSTFAPHMVSSLGIYVILEQATVLCAGPDVLMLVPGTHGVLSVFGFILPWGQIVILLTGGLTLVVFFTWTQLTGIGLRMRGLSESSVQMALLGHSVRRLRRIAFSVAGLMAGAVGIAHAYDKGIDPSSGLPALLLSLVAVVSGGRQGFLSIAIAGLLLGLVREQIVWVLSDRWQEAATYSLLACILIIRGNPHFKRWSQ